MNKFLYNTNKNILNGLLKEYSETIKTDGRETEKIKQLKRDISYYVKWLKDNEG